MNTISGGWRRAGLAAAAALFLMTVASPARGAQQSPIDIRGADVFRAPLDPLNFDYPGSIDLQVVNTGSPGEEATVRATPPPGAGSLSLAGTTYNLLQFHFHTPAEHEFDGRRDEMELHLVHQSAGGKLLVIARTIRAGAANATLEPIFADLPPAPGDERTVNDFDLSAVLPERRITFRYSGSLTTPPFTEGVLWSVFHEPWEMSQAQINAYAALFPEGDARDVQLLDGRVVLTDDPTAQPIPLPAAVLSGGATLLGLAGWRACGDARRRRGRTSCGAVARSK